MRILISICTLFLIQTEFALAEFACRTAYEAKGAPQKALVPNFEFSELLSQTYNRAQKGIVKVKERIEKLEDQAADLEDIISPPTWLSYTIPAKRESRKSKIQKRKEKDRAELELEKVNEKIETLEDLEGRLEALVVRETAKVQADVAKKIDSTLKAYPKLKRSFRDQLNYRWLMSLQRGKFASFVTGESNSQSRAPLPQEIRLAIRNQLKHGQSIIFDGESAHAQSIATIVGNRGVAIFSRESLAARSPIPTKVVIKNDFLRMEALAHADTVVTDTQSTVGLGLIFDNHVDYVFNVNFSSLNKSLTQWQDHLDRSERNLGVYLRIPTFIRKASKIAEPSSGQGFGQVRSKVKIAKGLRPPKPNLSDQSLESLKDAFESSRNYLAVLSSTESRQTAAVFGSSQYDPISTKFLYEAAYSLGSRNIGVVTGGSGGAMHTANSGAFHAGADSIGVPIGGKHALSTEKDVFSDRHSLTVTTTSYGERIPVLLGNHRGLRDLVVFAPGGAGTVKELAVTLIAAAGRTNTPFKQLVFLDKDYYDPLFRVLQNYNLSGGLSNRLSLVGQVGELNQKLDQLGYVTHNPPTPRAPKKDFGEKRESNTDQGALSKNNGSSKGKSSDENLIDINVGWWD